MLDACRDIQTIVGKHYAVYVNDVLNPLLQDLERFEQEQLSALARSGEALADRELTAFAEKIYHIEHLRQAVVLRWRRMERLAVDGPGEWLYERKAIQGREDDCTSNL